MKEENDKAYRYLVVIFGYGGMHWQCTQSLMESMICLKDRAAFKLAAIDSVLERSRSRELLPLIEQPYLKEHNWLLDVVIYIDRDQSWSPDSLDMLAEACRYSESIVGSVISKKTDTRQMVASIALDDNQLRTAEPGKLIPAQYVGAGMTAYHLFVVQDVWASSQEDRKGLRYPFGTTFRKNDMMYLAEDWAFCERASALGHQPYLMWHPDVGHWGDKEYKIDPKRY